MCLDKNASCVLCGDEGVSWYSGLLDRMLDVPGAWGFRKCPGCGLLWLDPRPVIDDICKAYTKSYCTHIVEERTTPFSSLMEWIETAGWAGRFLGSLPMIRDVAGARKMFLEKPQGGSLLDVGCGNGSFLAGMKQRGWEVLGLEADSVSARLARERFGLGVVEGRLDEVDLPEDAFDAVTARHVIEHVHDPVLFLRQCYRLVAPGGTMAVLTPNARSLGHRLFHRNWSELDPPRHLYMFNVKTLALAAELAGLPSSLSIRSTARAARWTWEPSVAIRAAGQVSGCPPVLKPARFMFWAVEDALRMFAGINCGEELVLTITKPGSVDEGSDGDCSTGAIADA